MRISDWSSDVCSSDLMAIILDDLPPLLHRLDPNGLLDDFMDKSVLAGVRRREQGKLLVEQHLDRPERIAARQEHLHAESVARKIVVEAREVSVRLAIGARSFHTNKKRSRRPKEEER